MDTHATDVLVIGTGIAGLSFALRVAERARVAMVTKKETSASSTNYAQGGMASVLAPTDSFEAQYAESLPAVIGNRQRLEQVVVNLVQNACEALANRAKSIRVATIFEPDTESVVVVVEDEGVGIPPEQLKDLTVPFFTTKRDQGGTGLGLSVSSGIVEEHDGELSFASTHGQGTCAKLILPASRPCAPPTEALQ